MLLSVHIEVFPLLQIVQSVVCYVLWLHVIFRLLQFDSAPASADLAWAAADGQKTEAERVRKLAEQEKADFEFALALSKAES